MWLKRTLSVVTDARYFLIPSVSRSRARVEESMRVVLEQKKPTCTLKVCGGAIVSARVADASVCNVWLDA